MTLDSTAKRTYVTVTAPAEVDMASSNTLRDEIEFAIKANPWVIVDLSPVEFIDSTGLSALVVSRTLAEHYGGHLALVGPGDRTLRMLHLTQLDKVFDIYPTPESVPSPRSE